METVITVFAVLILGIFAFAAFGATIGKKDMDDLESLEWFAEKCQPTKANEDVIRAELERLSSRGLIPEERVNDIALLIRRKFKA